MACLYVATSKLYDWQVVKYGISKHDEPWPRLVDHDGSRDNPFAQRLVMHGALCIQLSHVRFARNVESVIKASALHWLPRVGTHARPTTLSIPSGRQPSGEWLLHPAPHGCRSSVSAFYRLARAALQVASDDMAFARQCLGRAQVEWDADVGYMNFHRDGSVTHG